tara:strand:- start:5116 stop:6117 length:1002 start_codon:yes stop_codon:yes gene_type:complete
MKNKTIMALVLIGMSTGFLSAQSKVGQAGFTFLKIGVGARTAGMGEAAVASVTGASAIFFNPAGLARSEGGQAQFSLNTWIAGIQHQAVAASYAIDGVGVVGLSYVGMNYGDDIHYTYVDASGAEGYSGGKRYSGGTVDVGESAIGVAFSRAFSDKFSLGAHVKLVSQNLGQNDIVTLEGDAITRENKLGAVALDFGTLYYTGIKDLAFGMGLTNFSRDLSYESEKFQLPLTMRTGISMTVLNIGDNQSVVMGLDALHPRDFDERVHAGLEYKYGTLAAVRAGYKFNYDNEGLTFGAGLNLNVGGAGVLVDYAYSAFGDYFGNVNRITVGVSF